MHFEQILRISREESTEMLCLYEIGDLCRGSLESFIHDSWSRLVKQNGDNKSGQTQNRRVDYACIAAGEQGSFG